MGGVQSTDKKVTSSPTSSKSTDETGKLIITPKVVQKIHEIGDILKMQKENKLNKLYSTVDIDNMAKQLGLDQPAIADIKKRITVLQEILRKNQYNENADNNNPADMKDRYLAMFTDPELKKKKDELYEVAKDVITDTTILGSRESEGHLVNLMENIVKLNTNNRFLEYKYVMLNIATIAIIKKLYESIQIFMADVANFNNARSLVQSKAANDLVKKLVDIMSTADLNIDAKEFEVLNGSLENMTGTIDVWKKKFDDSQDAMQKQIAVALGKIAIMDNEVIGQDNRYGSTVSVSNPSDNFGAGQQRTSPFNQNSRPSQFDQQGGFVRSGSHFPDEFYSAK